MTDINLNSNKIINNLRIDSTTPAKNKQEAPQIQQADRTHSDLINKYLDNQAQINKPSVNKTEKINDVGSAPANYKNNLRSMFRNNEAVILAIVPRTFTAVDKNGDELIKRKDGEKPGTFLSAINRLDEIKAEGFNTFHILPIHQQEKVTQWVQQVHYMHLKNI